MVRIESVFPKERSLGTVNASVCPKVGGLDTREKGIRPKEGLLGIDKKTIRRKEAPLCTSEMSFSRRDHPQNSRFPSRRPTSGEEWLPRTPITEILLSQRHSTRGLRWTIAPAAEEAVDELLGFVFEVEGLWPAHPFAHQAGDEGVQRDGGHLGGEVGVDQA